MNMKEGPNSKTIIKTSPFVFSWDGQQSELTFDNKGLQKCLLLFNLTVYAVRENNKIGFTNN